MNYNCHITEYKESQHSEYEHINGIKVKRMNVHELKNAPLLV